MANKTEEFEGKVVNDKNRHVVYDDGTGNEIDWNAIRNAGLIKGVATLGYGTNVEEGLDENEAKALLTNRQFIAAETISDIFGDELVNNISDARIYALIDMVYNLGEPRFKKFKKTIKAIKENDWEKASVEVLDSKWAEQVGRRAQWVSEVFKTGEKSDV